MRRQTLPLLLLCSACTTDVIEHALDGGNGTGTTDTGVADSGRIDAGFADAGAEDASEMDGGSACSLTASPVELMLPDTDVGSLQSGTILVGNAGATDCTVTEIAVTPAGAFSLVQSPFPAVLAPGDMATVEIEFAPTTAGDDAAALRITATDDLVEVALSGRGVQPADVLLGDVTFVVENTTAEDRYVVTSGMFCTVIDPGVDTELGFQCGCECPAPPDPSFTGLKLLAPGETHEIVWDGRELVTFTETLDCGGGFTVEELGGNLENVSFGTYAARVPFTRSVPGNCSPSGTAGEYFCNPAGGGGAPPAIADICPAEGIATTTYTIQSSGDQTVMVSILD